jgi:hypothetical protein
MAHHRHIFHTGTNIGTSFDPKNMNCYNCMGGEHPILVRGGEALILGTRPPNASC